MSLERPTAGGELSVSSRNPSLRGKVRIKPRLSPEREEKMLEGYGTLIYPYKPEAPNLPTPEEAEAFRAAMKAAEGDPKAQARLIHNRGKV